MALFCNQLNHVAGEKPDAETNGQYAQGQQDLGPSFPFVFQRELPVSSRPGPADSRQE
jgi:hypothetical protein